MAHDPVATTESWELSTGSREVSIWVRSRVNRRIGLHRDLCSICPTSFRRVVDANQRQCVRHLRVRIWRSV
jgi:hypothetical protein